jgi:hypothetical protein
LHSAPGSRDDRAVQSSAIMYTSTPLSPLDRLPAPRILTGMGFYWWMPQKAVLITQMLKSHATVAACIAFHDLIDDLLTREKHLADAAGGITFVHDWRALRSFEEGVREEFVRRMRQRPRGYQRLAMVILNAENTAIQMAVMAGNAVAALATGRRVQITSDAQAALESVGLD